MGSCRRKRKYVPKGLLPLPENQGIVAAHELEREIHNF